VLIAQLNAPTADVLLLDEPTNDLDIPTLEILEETCSSFRGSLVLVTQRSLHARSRVHNRARLDGQGGAESFADYSQWEVWQLRASSRRRVTARLGPQTATS